MGDDRKVVQLFPDTTAISKDDMLKILHDMIKDVEADKMDYFTIAARLKEGTVATGWAGCDLVQRQELISHLQIDIMYKIMYTNLVGD